MPVFPNVFPLAAAGVAFSPRMLRRVLLIGALALLVPLLGLFVVGMHVPQAERESYEEMEAVAALKAEQIENWLSERRADGETLKSRGFVQRVAEWRRAGQASERAAIYDRLQIMKQVYGYGAIQLIDVVGDTLLALGEHDQLAQATRDRLPDAFAGAEVISTGLYADEQGKLHVDIIVPLLRQVNGRSEPIAAVVLHNDPQKFLFPFIQRWPTASTSAETLLVRREGQFIVYLNDLRHEKGTALTKRQSLNDQKSPAAVAIQTAKPGKMQGEDYRGVAVLAAFRPVAGTDWQLVAKIDRSEVLESVFELALWVGLVALFAVVLVTALMLRYLRQQRALQRLNLQAETAKIFKQFYDQPFIGMATFSPLTNRWLQCNDAVCSMLGYSRQELAEKTWGSLTHPDDLAGDNYEAERLLRGECDTFTRKKRYLHKDGTVVFAVISVQSVRHPDGAIESLVATIQDVSQRHAAEVKVQQLLQAIEQSPVSVVITDPQGTIEFVNRRFSEITGYSREEAIGRKPSLLQSGQTPRETYQALWQTLAAGKVWHGSFRNRSKDGEFSWEDATISPVRDSDGKTTHYIAVKEDVTERRQIEDTQMFLLQSAAQRLGEDFFLSLARHLADTMEMDLVRIDRLESDGLTARTMAVFCDGKFEENILYALQGTLCGALLGKNESVIESGVRQIFPQDSLFQEMRAESFVGRTLWSAEGKPIGYIAVAGRKPLVHANLAVTLLKLAALRASGELERQQVEAALGESETRFHAIFDHAKDGIVLADIETRAFILANKAFLKMSGYTLDELRRLHISDMHPKDDLPGLLEGFRQIARGEIDGIANVPVLRADGHVFYADIGGTPLELSGRRYMLGEFHDITERRRTHAALATALEAALVADKVKDELLANVSHELRTPLNAVIGLANLVRDASRDPKQRDMLDKIASAGQTLAGIINDLLDLSKIAAGQLQFESTPFSLRRQLLRSYSMMSHKASEKGLELLQRVEDDVPDDVRGDPLRLEQILLNLLSNAIKFTQQGRVEVNISHFAREEARVGLLLEVSDTGIGLRAEDLERLFKPFSQADASTTRRYGGTGLGLAICKRLAEMMGGSIEALPREGGGTIFRVRMWLELAEVVELESSSKEPLPLCYRNAQVLVVEDQPFNRVVVEGLLNQLGITPRVAINGQEALDLLDEAGPDAFDLILMDIQMPVLDGESATRAIRARSGFANLPIIAMTAHSMTHERERFAAAGMNDHIGKPFDAEHFRRVLARWIDPAKRCELVVDTEQSVVPAVSGFPAIAGVDTDAGLSILMGDAERYRYWLKEFVDQTPGFAQQVRQALSTGSSEQASFVAHALKGRMGMLGMFELHTMAAALEETLELGDPADEKLDAMQQAIERMRRAIVLALNVDSA